MLTNIFENGISMLPLLECLGTAIILGILVAVVFSYKNNSSRSLILSLTIIPVVVATVILLVNGNIGAGVAVAGAFTLVRYRSVPGTAREISAIFITMAIGLACGMGYIGVAVIMFVLVSVLILLLTMLNFGGNASASELRITIPENLDYAGLFDDIFEKYHIRAVMKKLRLTNMGTLFEVTYHVSFAGSVIPKEAMDAIRVRNGNLNIIYGEIAEKDSL